MAFNYRDVSKVVFDCVLCGAADYEVLVNGDRYGMGIQTSGCKVCGLVQTSPRPSSESMSDFYKFHYRDYYQSATAADSNYVQQYRKGIRLTETVGRIIEAKPLAAGARILDVGCAEGTLFEQFNQRLIGLKLVGIEPYEPFAAYARSTTGCTTFPSVDDLLTSSESEKFDVIVVNHVLEHVSDPSAFIRKLLGLLAGDGVLYIDVPDVELYSSAEDIHLAHIFHFSERTLRACCEKAGGSIIGMEKHVPSFHPKSVRCFVAAGASVSVMETSMATECDAWDVVRHLQMRLKLYTLKMKVRQLPLMKPILKLLRSVR